MAKGSDRPNAPKGRDPAKHSKKDPAKPTRAKAARPDSAHLDPALAKLLNPAIGEGRAGIGAQTGIEAEQGKARPLTSPRRAGGAGRAPRRRARPPPPRNPWSTPLTRSFGPASPHRGEAKGGRSATAV
jgi:hypothetical protein